MIRYRHTMPRFIAAMRRAPDVVMEEVDRVIGRVAIEGAREAKREAPKAFSELTNSIRNEQIGLGFHRIIADAPHAEYREKGSPPQRLPPIDIIRRWIETKRIQPRTPMTIEDLAWLIARAISRRGTKPQPYMEPARQTSIDRLEALLPAAARRATERALS